MVPLLPALDFPFFLIKGWNRLKVNQKDQSASKGATEKFIKKPYLAVRVLDSVLVTAYLFINRHELFVQDT